MSALAAPALEMNVTRNASRRARVLADHVRGVSRAPTYARRRTIVATKAASRDGDVEVSDAEMTRLTGLVSGKIESNDVVVWAKSWCPYCDKVKALFQTMEVTHLAVDLDKFNEEKALVKVLTEMTGQRDDLEKSIEDLRATISRLNKLSRQRFHETFIAVNDLFKQLFPKLFQGGKAWLELTDEANLLETGVEIYVRPPGKKVGNLNLLSGGEKALTAVSLIFSLFLFKPSPFCVLDEVDAPLDDANIGRFAGMVSEMCDRSQFVLITHNKRTMEACDMLYGVTMQEPGVSKIVSVEIDR